MNTYEIRMEDKDFSEKSCIDHLENWSVSSWTPFIKLSDTHRCAVTARYNSAVTDRRHCHGYTLNGVKMTMIRDISGT